MTDEQKKKLVKYLFPREDIRLFLINDVYMEIALIIPPYILFDKQNYDAEIRNRNYEHCFDKINEFLKLNSIYLKKLKEYKCNSDIKKIIDELLVGYSFYVSQTNDIFKNIDIFKEERSVCYREVSIVEFL